MIIMSYGTYIYKIRGLMAIKRYQNKFRFKNRSVAEHEWSVSRIAQGLALWQMEYSDKKIDMGELLQRTLLHDSIKIFLGDIQSNATDFVEMKEAVEEVKEILYETNFKQLLPNSWQDKFKKYVLSSKDNSIESKIVTASNSIDKILECVEEIELGNKRMFVDILKAETEKLIDIDLDVAKWFVVYCLEDLGLKNIKRHYGNKVFNFVTEYKEKNGDNYKNYQKTFAVYLYRVRDLMETERYQNLDRHRRRTVAQHEWAVSRTAHGLALWETCKFGNKVDMYELLSTTLVHDTPEVLVGDILSNVKRTTQRMLEAVEKREQIAFEKELKPLLPNTWHEEFRKKMLFPKDDTIEGKIISASDIIDTILESVEEINLGNSEYFKEILKAVTEKLISSDLQSVKYFMRYSLQDFGLDIKEYYGDKVYDYVQELQNYDL